MIWREYTCDAYKKAFKHFNEKISVQLNVNIYQVDFHEI